MTVQKDRASVKPVDVRRMVRERVFTGPTHGFSSGYIQANLLVMPKKYRDDFVGLCKRNPVPCPLIAESVPGDPTKCIRDGVGKDLNIGTDVPWYQVYRPGKKQPETVAEIASLWTEEYVGFLIGCSYSFEEALVREELPPRHMETGVAVPMYRTSIRLHPSGVFGGTYVVSMRPYKKKDIETVRRASGKYISSHGEPIGWGWNEAERLGIKDINNPDFGDSVEIKEDEIPVFWGCGVTTQAAVMDANIPEPFFAHRPGYMLVTDLEEKDIMI
jgi:uncharacterized protein YcsI (UPF0317 family)